jgi:hypothetical protein
MNQFLKEFNQILKGKYGTFFFILLLVVALIFTLKLIGPLVQLAVAIGVLFLIFRLFNQTKK